MQFGYVILYVGSVADTVAFYGRAFGLEAGLVADTYAELVTGPTKLAFADARFVREHAHATSGDAALDRPAPPMEIGLVTDAVDAAYARAVAAGAVPVKAPAQKPWGQWVDYVRDPNGFVVELCAPMPP